jgi:sugar phosphate isomerase/epimerase
MKMSIFNIAWDRDQDFEIAPLLLRYGFKGVEIAPAKIWQEPSLVSVSSATKYRHFWTSYGLSISSLCSLFYPHQELNFFDGKRSQKRMLDYFQRITDLATWLGAEKLVFGSPTNRTYSQTNLNVVDDISQNFFYQLAQIAQEKKLVLCIEPIPIALGTNFINSTNEALKLIENVNHPAFKLHLDSGAMTVNQENVEIVFKRVEEVLEHIHISEDFLGEIGTGRVDHKLFSKMIHKINYSKWLVVEMRTLNNSNNIQQIVRVLEFMKRIYINE